MQKEKQVVFSLMDYFSFELQAVDNLLLFLHGHGYTVPKHFISFILFPPEKHFLEVQ
jgi:hypothetical protein